MAALAPIETGAGEGAAGARERVQVDAETGEERAVLEELARAELLIHPHAALAGEVVVADARDAQRGIGWAGARLARDARQLFERRGDVGGGETEGAGGAWFFDWGG